MTYSEKLKNPLWQKKRIDVLCRDDYKCVMCGDYKTELHVHHIRYTGEPWEAPMKDLETLCRVCHQVKTFYSTKYTKGIRVREGMYIYLLTGRIADMYYYDGDRHGKVEFLGRPNLEDSMYDFLFKTKSYERSGSISIHR